MTTIQSIHQQRKRKRKAAALIIALLDEDERQVQRSCWVSKFLKQRDDLGAKERKRYYVFLCLAISSYGRSRVNCVAFLLSV